MCTLVHMPDIPLLELLSRWLSVKGVVIKYSLWNETIISWLPHLCSLQIQQTLYAYEVMGRLVSLLTICMCNAAYQFTILL